MKLVVTNTVFATLTFNAICSINAVAGILIDDFETGSIDVSRLGGSVVEETQTGLDPSHIIGGERLITVGQSGDAPQHLNIDAGQLKFNSGDSFGYFQVAYGSSTSPLNLDLLASGANAFVLDFEAPYVPLARIVLRSSTGSENPSIGNFDTVFFPSGLARVVVPFDAYGSVDLRQVEEIVLDVSRVRPLSQIAFLRIATIPEPSSVCLLALGALGLSVIRGWHWLAVAHQCDKVTRGKL